MGDRYNVFIVDVGSRFVLVYIQYYLIPFRHEDKIQLPITPASFLLPSGQVAPQVFPLFSLYWRGFNPIVGYESDFFNFTFNLDNINEKKLKIQPEIGTVG
jgi:hypothetical protein